MSKCFIDVLELPGRSRSFVNSQGLTIHIWFLRAAVAPHFLLCLAVWSLFLLLDPASIPLPGMFWFLVSPWFFVMRYLGRRRCIFPTVFKNAPIGFWRSLFSQVLFSLCLGLSILHMMGPVWACWWQCNFESVQSGSSLPRQSFLLWIILMGILLLASSSSLRFTTGHLAYVLYSQNVLSKCWGLDMF